MKKYKNIGIYAVVILILALIVMLLISGTSERRLKYSDVLGYFENNQVESFVIDNSTLEFTLKADGNGTAKTESFELYSVGLFLEDVDPYIYTTDENGVKTRIMDYDLIPPPQTSIFLSLLPYLLIGGVFVVFLFIMYNQMNGGGGKAMSFGRARLKVSDANKKKVMFSDVAGADEEKEELIEVVDFLL